MGAPSAAPFLSERWFSARAWKPFAGGGGRAYVRTDLLLAGSATSRRRARERFESAGFRKRCSLAGPWLPGGPGVGASDARRPEAPRGLSRTAPPPMSEAGPHASHRDCRPAPQATRATRWCLSLRVWAPSPLCSSSQPTVPKAGFRHTHPRPGRRQALSTRAALPLCAKKKTNLYFACGSVPASWATAS